MLGFIFNCIQIYLYSSEYSEVSCDAVIVLGAGTSDGKLSPVFRERINHAVYLYEKGVIDKVILTGGYGKGQKYADSEVARDYMLQHNIPEADICIEKSSKYTIENLAESKGLMDSLGLHTALLTSDPLHMKRSMALAEKYGIDCKPSPTRTSMYKTAIPKAKFLLYESFYYSLGVLTGTH